MIHNIIIFSLGVMVGHFWDKLLPLVAIFVKSFQDKTPPVAPV